MARGLPPPAEIAIFREELDTNMKYIWENLHRVPAGSRGFVKNVCDWYFDKDTLSDKQAAHMLLQWRDLKNEVAVTVPEHSRSDHQVKIDCTPLLEMFDKARQHKQNPKLVYYYTSDNLHKLVFYIMHHRDPGSIGVIQDNGIVGQGKRMAIINPKGLLRWEPWASIEMRKIIKDLVTENPEQKFAINGKEHRFCCFCSLELTNPESIARGYGPICATNWGLPWDDDGTARSQQMMKEIEG